MRINLGPKHLLLTVITIVSIISGLTLSSLIEGRKYKDIRPLTENLVSALPLDTTKYVLTFAGDLMAHNVNYHMSDYNDIYANMGACLQTDYYSFTNFEMPMDDSRPMSTFPRFNVHSQYLRAAVKAGFDVFSLANNHSLDHGPESLKATLKGFQSASSKQKLFFNGTRADITKPFKPVILSAGKYKIGFIASTGISNIGRGLAHVNYVNYGNNKIKEAFLDTIRGHDKDCDILIISFHDGVEYTTVPAARKKKFYKEMVSAGADIVWGHHPHVLQPYEFIMTPTGRKLIMYSTGNLISGMTWNMSPQGHKEWLAYTGESALMQVTLQESVCNGKRHFSITEINPVMIVNYRHPRKGMIIHPMKEAATSAEIPPQWNEYYQTRTTASTSMFPAKSRPRQERHYHREEQAPRKFH